MSANTNSAQQLGTIEQISSAIDACQSKYGVAIVTLANLNELTDKRDANAHTALVNEFQQRIIKALRPTDGVIIVSNDHICLVFDDLLDNNHLRLAGLKISRIFDHTIDIGDSHLELEVVIGLVYAGRQTASSMGTESLYQLAKQTCAKAIGEGYPYLVVNAADSKHEDRDWHLNQRFSTAMENHHISMDYQPKVALSSGHLVGAEALVRWRDNGIIVPPDEYIAGLNNSVMWQLTVYVYRRILREILDFEIDLPVAINIDPSNLTHPEFIDFMRREANLWGVPCEQISLEITENRALFDIAHSKALLTDIRNNGFKISLDDFGAGHSNMRRIRELPLDEIKLDRSICADVLSNPDSNNISQTVIELAQTLNITTVAEGIEDAATLAKLADMGADVGQGFYLSAPLTVEAFANLNRTKD